MDNGLSLLVSWVLRLLSINGPISSVTMTPRSVGRYQIPVSLQKSHSVILERSEWICKYSFLKICIITVEGEKENVNVYYLDVAIKVEDS